ncbi:hypothetical protein GCM10010116_25840 [Microbispora rosea subsp. aerata]|nr:hypothetical protein [Microbispora rosea]GGO12855.1 hypothetical protein GCM10010116_25840 [Microbispora rosea subsp. aerata]GIH54146.1 hypothetical protein Mro02_10600 [Microbispora rosea subsp. aerata]GLJ85120.1 hypothetical protein GCM10017588_38480 [Microbispora rosea subsp. aerata]
MDQFAAAPTPPLSLTQAAVRALERLKRDLATPRRGSRDPDRRLCDPDRSFEPNKRRSTS